MPSTVLNIGLRSPPRSNSCAEIFLTGVVAPEPPREAAPPPPCVGEDSSTELEVGVAWDTSHESTTCLVAFLKT